MKLCDLCYKLMSSYHDVLLWISCDSCIGIWCFDNSGWCYTGFNKSVIGLFFNLMKWACVWSWFYKFYLFEQCRRSWLVDGNRFATKIKLASGTCDAGQIKWNSNPTRLCPSCQHTIDNSDVLLSTLTLVLSLVSMT